MATYRVTFRVVLAGTAEVEADSEQGAREDLAENGIPPRDLDEARIEDQEVTSVTEVG
jgi:type II secretory pathway component PulF